MTDEDLDDIVSDLRDEAATAEASEGDYYADQFTYHGCGEAADAIEWLRAEIARLRLELFMRPTPNLLVQSEAAGLRLTDEERKAVGVALQCVEAARCQKHPEELAAAVTLIRADATLRKLLERTK